MHLWQNTIAKVAVNKVGIIWHKTKVYCISGTTLFSVYFYTFIDSLMRTRDIVSSQSLFPFLFSIEVSPTWMQTNNVINCYHWQPAGVTFFQHSNNLFGAVQTAALKGLHVPVALQCREKKHNLQPNTHLQIVFIINPAWHLSLLWSFRQSSPSPPLWRRPYSPVSAQRHLL